MMSPASKNGAMDISNMLATRSHAYAMLGVAHLSLTKNLDAKMMSAYGKKFEATASHRAINPQELQKADQLIWDEIFRLSRQKDWTVERAIFEVTENGFTERKLEPVPCIPRATTDLINSLKGSVGKGKGNERKRSNAQMSTSAQDDQSWTRVEKKRKGKAKGKGGKGNEEKPKDSTMNSQSTGSMVCLPACVLICQDRAVTAKGAGWDIFVRSRCPMEHRAARSTPHSNMTR